MRFAKLALACLACLATGTAAQSQELVTNGGFETGDFTGWTQVSAVVVTTPGLEGNYAATFGPDLPVPPFLPSITQTLATASGASYTLSFDLEQTTQFTDMRVYFGSSGLPIYEQIGVGDGLRALTVVADAGTSTDLQFWGDLTDQYVLDSISVTAVPTSTPEPGSVALLAGMGLSGAGFLVRRHKNARKSAFLNL